MAAAPALQPHFPKAEGAYRSTRTRCLHGGESYRLWAGLSIRPLVLNQTHRDWRVVSVLQVPPWDKFHDPWMVLWTCPRPPAPVVLTF